MKTKLSILLVLLSFYSFSQNVTETEARQIMQERFISLSEAQTIFPELPNELEIPYCRDLLENDFISYLIPINNKGKAEYLLVQASYMLDTLIRSKEEIIRSDAFDLAEAQEAICLLSSLRPSFPNKTGITPPFKYFFRVKDYAPDRQGLNFQKAINYSDKILTVELPSSMESGLLDSKRISYLEEIKGQSILGFEKLPPDFPEIAEQNIFVLDIIYLRY